ncbi:MAG: hypothetical protein ACFHWX_05995 [Bacteroidota bacterium]
MSLQSIQLVRIRLAIALILFVSFSNSATCNDNSQGSISTIPIEIHKGKLGSPFKPPNDKVNIAITQLSRTPIGKDKIWQSEIEFTYYRYVFKLYIQNTASNEVEIAFSGSSGWIINPIYRNNNSCTNCRAMFQGRNNIRLAPGHSFELQFSVDTDFSLRPGSEQDYYNMKQAATEQGLGDPFDLYWFGFRFGYREIGPVANTTSQDDFSDFIGGLSDDDIGSNPTSTTESRSFLEKEIDNQTANIKPQENALKERMRFEEINERVDLNIQGREIVVESQQVSSSQPVTTNYNASICNNLVQEHQSMCSSYLQLLRNYSNNPTNMNYNNLESFLKRFENFNNRYAQLITDNQISGDCMARLDSQTDNFVNAMVSMSNDIANRITENPGSASSPPKFNFAPPQMTPSFGSQSTPSLGGQHFERGTINPNSISDGKQK